MPNLKPYLDAARDADTEVRRILNEMDTLFNDGTEEGKKKALELRPALDTAKVNAQEANELYVSMRDASLVNDNAAPLFSAPADPAAQSDQAQTPKVMNRSAFDGLDVAEKAKFVNDGVKVVDD